MVYLFIYCVWRSGDIISGESNALVFDLNLFCFTFRLLPGLMISNVSSLPSVVGVNTPLPTLYVLVRLDIL